MRERRKSELKGSAPEAVALGQAEDKSSLVRRVGRWLYRGPPDDPKMLEFWHPTVVSLISHAAIFLVLHFMDQYILRSELLSPITTRSCPRDLLSLNPESPIQGCRDAAYWSFGGTEGPESSIRIRNAASIFLVIYHFCILGLRTAALGWQNIYEALWGCNIGLVVGAAGLYFNRPLWAGGMIFALAIDQMLWYVDVICYLIKGKFPIGVAAYLTWEETHIFKKITCAHHLWFTPLIASIFAMYPPSPVGGFPFVPTVLMGLTIQWMIVILPRMFLPCSALWPAETKLSPEEERKAKKDKYGRPLTMLYLNVNLSYGPWKDVKVLGSIFSPKWAFGSRWFQFLPYMQLPWGVTNAILCLPFFLFL
eukprot:Blabericola_migrator_1__3550@NODE_2053_length_3353_cov_218_206634_g50_i1_p2_GENE_NODE_2053_length_3353_cov_218_206634_g50_i1NODE_2053_length_3353_cov_218_206634_g50_i1_p2_ORF_typecomplete_len365_score51_14_NODE_2053_length_3353_cov_218_206634_g50_i122583352